MNFFEEREICRRLPGLASGSVGDGRFAPDSKGPRYTPDRTFASSHLKLEIDLDFARKSFTGRASLSLRALRAEAREITFDAVQMKIRRVEARGRKISFKHDGKKLKIQLPKAPAAGETVEVVISYSVSRPRLGLFFIDNPRQVWTQGQDEYARYWFPCLDAPEEKMTTEMVATVPSGFTAVSNGNLVSKTRRGGKDVFHYSMSTPFAPYLVTLTAGRFSEIKHYWQDVPVLYYCEKGREKDTERAFGKTPDMLEFFSSKLGVPYPYEKYAQIAAAHFIYGGMENTSATTQTDQVLCDTRGQVEGFHDHLVAHELAHQWFGDLLTCKEWAHGWLNEGFATYFQALYEEHDKGRDHFLYDMLDKLETYLEEAKGRYSRPIVTAQFRDPSDLFDRHLYEKGALVLNMIRHELGDDLFYKALNHYLTVNRASVVETQDLVHAIREATGRNMQPFFDQWIYQAGHPDLKVHLSLEDGGRKAVVRVRQVQKPSPDRPLFRLPLTFWFDLPGGPKEFKENFEAKESVYTYRLPGRPRIFRVDPGGWILKTLNVIQPAALWFNQLRSDPDVRGRIEAVRHLGNVASPEALAALASALRRERFWGLQAEIASALGRTRKAEAARILKGAQGLRDIRARRAVVAALAGMKDKDCLAIGRRALGAKDSHYVTFQGARTLGQAEPGQAFAILKSLLGKKSWNHGLTVAALDGLAALGGDKVFPLLKARTASNQPYQVRMAAIRALGRTGQGRADVTSLLTGLGDDPHIRVQLSVPPALGDLMDPAALPKLEEMTKREHCDGRVRRLADEAIRKISYGQGISKKER